MSSVDYHDSDAPLPKAELIARLQGRARADLPHHRPRSTTRCWPPARPAGGRQRGGRLQQHRRGRGHAGRGVVVTNTPDVLTETTADFAWALLMAAGRAGWSRPTASCARASGTPWEWTCCSVGGDIHGKTLGVVGFGRIGRAVARRALGFGMRVLYHDAVRADAAVERELQRDRAPTCRRSSASPTSSRLHTPLAPGDAAPHQRARAPHHEEDRRTWSTRPGAPWSTRRRSSRRCTEGWIAGAGLDVFEDEPKVHPGLLAARQRRARPAHRQRLARHPASRWPRWPSTTAWPCWTASRRSTPVIPKYARARAMALSRARRAISKRFARRPAARRRRPVA